jgi:hypothetical protein
MTKAKEENNPTSGYALALTGMILMMGAVTFSYVYPHLQREEVKARVVKISHRQTDYGKVEGFVVETTEGRRWLDNTNSLLEGKINAEDIKELVKEGRCYLFEMYGGGIIPWKNVVMVREERCGKLREKGSSNN